MGTKKALPVPQLPVDFVIVTALPEERDALLAKLPGARKVDKEIRGIHTFYAWDPDGLGHSMGVKAAVVHQSAPGFAQGGGRPFQSGNSRPATGRHRLLRALAANIKQ